MHQSDLLTIDKAHVWHPFTQAKTAKDPILIERAKGSYLFTSEGQKLFDGISSWWTCAHGHNNEIINDAINAQLKKMEHVIFAGFTHEPAIKLSKSLVDLCSNDLKKVFFSDSGSSAIEIALKMAFQYWQNKGDFKPYIIAMDKSYHGDTFGAMSVGERSLFNKPFWPFLFNVLRINSPKNEQEAKNSLEELQNLFSIHKNKIASLIVEPHLQGAGGMNVFPPNFMSSVQNIVKQNSALLILDEVMTGFFRTGKLFAYMHENLKPDILCLAKGLSGGYLPLAVTLATDNIYEAFLQDTKAMAFLHGHSFTANPLACAAANASIDIFKEQKTKEHVENIVNTTSKCLQKFISHPKVKDIRQIGTVGIIEIKALDEGYESSISSQLHERCLQKDLFIRPLGNVVYLMPPYSSSLSEIEWAYDVIWQNI